MNEIELREVSFRYPGAEELALKNLSVTIRKKDFTAIVGNNGCGKSTLCKVMNGLIPYYLQGDYSGETLVSGENTATLEIGEIAHRIGYVYQDFENQIVRPTVLDDASYSCFNYGHEDYVERGLEALVQCGLEEKTLEYVFQLSGGQTHLLALAGTLALGPDVLILDEPIAQLDPANSDRIYRILQWLNDERDKTILVIEHHTDYIAEYCKEVILMESGQIRWKKETKEALRLVEDLFQNQIYPPQITQAAHELQKIHRVPASVELPVHLGETEAFFTKYGRLLANRIDKEEESPKQETAVAFSDIHLSYDSIRGEPNVVFDGLNLSLMRGEKIALIGSNGAGKSTLMKMLVNLLKPGRGSITLMDRNLRETNAETIARHISLVYQNPEEMFIMDTIEEDISFAMRERKVEGWEEKTADLLDAICLTEHFNTSQFLELYRYLKQNAKEEGDTLLFRGLRIFPAIEIDVSEGMHSLCIGKYDTIVEIYTRLSPYRQTEHFLPFHRLMDFLERFFVLTGLAHPFREGREVAGVESEQLKRLDFVESNGKDVAQNRDRIIKQTRELANRLELPIIGGSDTHQAMQYGTIRVRFHEEIVTLERLKHEVSAERYEVEISDFASEKVKAANLIKKSLKEIHALGGDYVSILT